ncbi:UDP-N-acetylmuramoyl-L-alanine--D-glutamate ligase [Bdellovibrio sp. HCB274]|uniref:UDP-N-acetylmuramoyl-L-alanine--D-glutamate ligase n=1 Tax=Bdellovibrio sp. HCB274 TaxID=3394361 RepID=UPI0039B54B3E
MSQYIKNLKAPIAIVGMGKSGDAAKRLLLACGVSAEDILTFDGKLASANFSDANKLMSEGKPQTLVVSPGVPLASVWIKDAQSRGIAITSEISLACSCLTSEKLIGVTGSVGKSTTVSLLQAGLEAFSKTGFVGGNLGIPFASYAADVVENKRPVADWVVLELSSYQLENCAGLVLDHSAITYFTSNHLERYDSIEHYYETKWNILGITKKTMLLNSEGGDLIEYSKGKSTNPQLKIISKTDPDLQSYQLQKAQLIGQHNQDNLALATALCREAGWPNAAVEGMKNFKGLSHRLENLGSVKGVRFINDSKATAMDSVIIAATAAADTLTTGGSLFLLLGGRDKNLPWEQLSVLSRMNHTEFVFFGECRDVAQGKSKLPGNSFARLEEAIAYIFSKVKTADTVLLSPGGTSWDEFKSFEDRGDFFKKKVTEFSTL